MWIRTIPAVVCAVALATPRLSADEAATISFVHDVRPVLSDKCFACHGPDEKTRDGGLRLDIRDDAVEADAIVPGKPDESELVRRILLGDDDDEKMPPKRAHKDLTAQETEILRKWIAEGAPYTQHWSYRPLARPDVPAIDHPRIKNPTDAFILDGLAKRGLELSPAADRVTLARRLYTDLLGVPPSFDEVQQFVDDPSADAYEKTVDRLLRDTRFGERMAVYWLDLVRYADTIGYHSDTHMEVSAYRDYVIDAFNKNKPFDQFTIEQLAGDLLPNPTQEHRVASGYNRLLQTTEEGGAQAREYVAIYAADRVRNVSGVWMGQTVGCAQCHDHKYDPITTRDFYSLAAFFADIKENAVGRRNPNLTLITPQQQATIDSLNQQIADLQLNRLLEKDEQLATRLQQGQDRWEAETLAAIDDEFSPWKTPDPVAVEATGGVELKRQDDGSWLSTGEQPATGNYTYTIETTGTIHAIRLEVFPDPSFPKQQGFSRSNGNFVLTDFKAAGNDQPVAIASAAADYEQPSWPVANAIDNHKTSGWAIDGHHKFAPRRTAVFRLANPLVFDKSPGKLRIELHHDSAHAGHLIGRFRISVTDKKDAGLEDHLKLDAAILAALRVPRDQRTEEHSRLLRDHYRTFAPELAESKKQLADVQKQLDDLRKSLPTTLVSEALPTPRMTRILPRGNWLDDSGEIVEPAVPQFLPHEKIEGRRANRLDLANWIVAEENPLTTRTFVNRLWKLFFGRGLSRNLDDLGGQGEPPTHPDLLDWLAVEFRDSGYDIKHMVRLLVHSSAYRQSSIATAELRARDPANRYYARQGRWRVEAEFVRDTALSLAGLLVDEKIGGRSVKPYQPAGYWQHLNFPKRTWQADKGESLYRRSLYTYWCRTFLHPSMLAFDAPSREECTAERSRSNIPQQALVLLNDPIFLEASRVFASRIVQAADEATDRITWATRTAWSRDPSADETDLLHSLYEDQLKRYSAAPDDARALIAVGSHPAPAEVDPAELAAWTQVARAIINAYETTSRF